LDYGRYKDWLRDEFQFRCAYCLHREAWERRGWRVFQADHIIPQSVDESKINQYNNLVYCCDSCNGFKSDKVIPDPCRWPYGEHYRFEPDGTVTALTKLGELYIEVLALDEAHLVKLRRKVFKNYQNLVELIAELGEDDEDLQAELHELLGYPDDAPDLRKKKPPINSRAEAVKDCYFVRLMDPEFSRLY
jgi:hypothetical protein